MSDTDTKDGGGADAPPSSSRPMTWQKEEHEGPCEVFVDVLVHDIKVESLPTMKDTGLRGARSRRAAASSVTLVLAPSAPPASRLWTCVMVAIYAARCPLRKGSRPLASSGSPWSRHVFLIRTLLMPPTRTPPTFSPPRSTPSWSVRGSTSISASHGSTLFSQTHFWTARTVPLVRVASGEIIGVGRWGRS